MHYYFAKPPPPGFLCKHEFALAHRNFKFPLDSEIVSHITLFPNTNKLYNDGEFT